MSWYKFAYNQRIRYHKNLSSHSDNIIIKFKEKKSKNPEKKKSTSNKNNKRNYSTDNQKTDMEKAQCLGRDNITINIEASFEVNFENGDVEQKSIECFADNVKLTCVWQQPEVNMHIINQIMNQINMFHDNSFGDCTPSNLTALISASFPSMSLNELSDDDNDDGNNNHPNDVGDADLIGFNNITTFVASTPISTIKTSNENAKNDNNDKQHQRQLLSLAFNNTSPILFQSRQRTLYTKRRLHLR